MITRNLNNRQQEAVAHHEGPLLIAAGAGSGKTHTLTSRLAALIERGVPPEQIIAITFTNKAAKEMLERVEKALKTGDKMPFVGTFHSFCARLLKHEAGLIKRTSNYTIYDEDDAMSLLKKVMKEGDVSKEQYSPMMLREKISTVKNELLDPEELLEKRVLKLYYDYETTLEKNNALDFDDLIEKTVRIFQNHPSVLQKYQDAFRYILVDEYQDVNTSQYQLVKLLAQKYKNLSVVGDDAQSIYSFRGSDFRNFLNFEKDWPQAKVVLLEENYRSTGTIIAAASRLLENNKFQKPKTLWTANPAGGPIRVINAADAEEEAAWVTETSRHEKGSRAILYRTNAQSRAIEQELIVANVPYRIFGGLKFYERKEVKDVVAALRLAANPQDSISAERIHKTFNRAPAEHLLRELPRLGKELKILELINFFLANTNYFEYLEKGYKNYSERIENINELIIFASEFKTLPEFLERVSLLASADSPAKAAGAPENPITLMTVHLAKGLEFNSTFVVGCSEGLLPHQRSYSSLESLEEERRLMYVAMTRAKQNLYLSFYGTPSRFLYELPPELTDFINLNGPASRQGGRKTLPDEDEMYIVDDF